MSLQIYRLKSGRRVPWRPIPEDEKDWPVSGNVGLALCVAGVALFLVALMYVALRLAWSVS